MDSSRLSPRRPYLLRAMYQWLLDNNLTPHLVVDVMVPGVMVPMEYASDGQIVLNIAPRAVHNLELGNDEVNFNARFGGVPRQVFVPLAAVQAIYARENNAGMMFEQEVAYLQPTDKETARAETKPGAHMSVVDTEHKQHDGDDDNPPPLSSPPRPGKPNLRVVK